MGYYAQGNGSVTLGPLTKKQAEEMDEILVDGYFECDSDYGHNRTYIALWCDDKYWEDSVMEELNALVPFGITSGEIEFIGDDNRIWRFLYQGDPWQGKWVEQNGRVVYDE